MATPTQKKWIANLLVNDKAVQPLLKYLMTTEVGGRDRGAKRESEWERHADQEGEDSLNSR